MHFPNGGSQTVTVREYGYVRWLARGIASIICSADWVVDESVNRSGCDDRADKDQNNGSDEADSPPTASNSPLNEWEHRE